ncbi:hypothetical protein LX15_005483 [Streptoalloteichus tenebrarius]|uniref:Uncharacterized protein n=1 Tax=Streptoalloteichus tenebrarius (strain ATCC 17920 / DSM 40477 / JCM 4838 / CBS 697.72 / NBRC 16177 / NCIMB 11028 / NRRL B-12390 / A12253. 1 / ISP 5477) TaxID=1933 RepID=A0ABT1I1U5_STRSD|nr:hypothetical protein [Streptoalloteichus tenebrarius]MCP2261757.1 hypothetical protein [Streptoalloteichus tenebrarius]BFF00813.1 hypothetical protein GCM10020241_24880 [Streptoalloteichus tenebrarius]
MTKGGRDKRSKPKKKRARRRGDSASNESFDGQLAAERALRGLLATNPPGRLTLAGAYAAGYVAIGLAQVEGDCPEWFHRTDPLDLLLLGMTFPQTFRDEYEFGNCRAAWTDLLRQTPHWKDVERFVSEAVQLSKERDLPIDSPKALLLLAGRLEAAGLDQHDLPRSLHPATAFSEPRFICGPRQDFTPPSPSTEALRRAEQFFADLKTGLAEGRTCADGLSNGLFLLEHFGLPVHTDSAALLVALYVGLVASDDEPPDELYDRATAWALGLREDSPIAQVTDTIMISAVQELSPRATVSRLFMIPDFTRPVNEGDRRWHSAPGTGFTPLAFEFGHREVRTRSGRTIKMDAVTAASLRSGYDKFEEEFGRPPGPGEFFEGADLETALIKMKDVLEAIGIHPAWVHAFFKKKLPLPNIDGSAMSTKDHRQWEKAVANYLRRHPEEEPPDHEHEISKLRRAATIMTIWQAITDPNVARALIATFDSDPSSDSSPSTKAVAELARGWSADLLRSFKSVPAMRERALDLARHWGGEHLEERISACAEVRKKQAQSIDPAVLFVLASAAVAMQAVDLHRSDERV